MSEREGQFVWGAPPQNAPPVQLEVPGILTPHEQPQKTKKESSNNLSPEVHIYNIE